MLIHSDPQNESELLGYVVMLGKGTHSYPKLPTWKQFTEAEKENTSIRKWTKLEVCLACKKLNPLSLGPSSVNYLENFSSTMTI